MMRTHRIAGRGGDQLLSDVAERLRACVRESDTVARLGGDEFTVILEALSRPEEAAEVAEKILASLRRPVTLSGQEVLIGGSIGISLYPSDGTDTKTLIQHADVDTEQPAAGRVFDGIDEVVDLVAKGRGREQQALEGLVFGHHLDGLGGLGVHRLSGVSMTPSDSNLSSITFGARNAVP